MAASATPVTLAEAPMGVAMPPMSVPLDTAQVRVCRSMPKVSAIRRWIDEKNPGCELEVDGGVDAVTGPQCVAAGANLLVAGSAVFGKADMAGAVRGLKGL